MNPSVNFHLTVDQFQRLLQLVLADECPDRITNVVLLACTRPRHGIISVPVAKPDAEEICAVVDAGAASDSAFADLAQILREHLSH